MLYWVLPGLAWLFVAADLVFASVDSAIRHEWGSAVLFLAFLAPITIMCHAVTRVYEVSLRGDVLGLHRPFRDMELRLEQLTGIEVPLKAAQLFPVVWLHWREPSGVRRIAKFVASRDQLPELSQFRERLAKRAPSVGTP